jgi:hypothetical protein
MSASMKMVKDKLEDPDRLGKLPSNNSDKDYCFARTDRKLIVDLSSTTCLPLIWYRKSSKAASPYRF